MWLLMSLSAFAAPSLWQEPRRGVADLIASPSGGDLVVLSRGRLDVLSPVDGSFRTSAALCSEPVAGGFRSAEVLVVVCENGAQAVSWPDLTVTELVSWSHEVDVGAVGAGVFATGNDEGRLQIFRGEQAETRELGREIEDLAWAADALVVAFDDTQPQQLLKVGAEPVYLPAVGDTIAVAFDGRHAFAKAGSFKAMFFELGAGSPRTVKTGSWLNDAAFLPSGDVLAGGSDGLVIYGDGPTPAKTLDTNGRWAHLTVGGGWFCAANWDAVGCWGVPGNVATQVVADAPSAEPAESATSEPVARSASLPTAEFIIRRRQGDRIMVELESGELPSKGQERTASKFVHKQIGPMNLSAWMGVGVMRVVSVQGATVELQLVEESSVMVVNGEKVDHFKPGVKLKLE